MQQKVVIKVPLNGQKSRCKALQIAVGVPGVTSAALTGQEMNQIEVTGDGIDAVALTTLLRKKVGYSELLSVGPVPADNDDGSSDSGGDQAAVQIPVGGYYHYPYPYAYGPGHMYGFRDQNTDSCCMM